MTTKRCSKCGETKDLDSFHKHPTTADRRQSWCKECRHKIDRRIDRSTPHVPIKRWGPKLGRRLTNRERHLKYDLGVDISLYDNMFKNQKGRCAICRGKKPYTHHGHFCIDHCHQSHKIRGLLCSHCNYMLGHAKDDPKRLRAAATYLELSRKNSAAVRIRTR